MNKLPSPIESQPDKNNIITRTEYTLNNKNEVIKTEKKIKRYTYEKKVYNSVVNRQNNWVKFGAAATDNNNITFVSKELVFMEPPSPPQSIIKDSKYVVPSLKLDENTFVEHIICKICEGQHWTRICPNQKEKEREDIAEIKYKEKNEYKPVSDKTKNMYKLQISNITKDITEFDLYTIFSNAGKIENITIMKDYNTQQSKGFGYIVFKEENDLNNALRIFNNIGFCYLRIKLERV